MNTIAAVLILLTGQAVPHTDISDRATFIAVEPCRLVDTRNANGDFGGPAFSADEIRTYDIPDGPCADIPIAAAYSLSFAVVSYSGPGWVTAFPATTTLPGVSTVNYGSSGPAVANAAIVPATSGSISVFARTATHVIIDINGYFIEPAGTLDEVIAGDGLTGGGTTGDLTLDAGFAGSGSATTAARSDHSHYANTIVVSPVGTQVENGTALAAAVGGISDSSSTNRYLVQIEPGVYNLQHTPLAVPGFVHIEGSGRDATVVTNAKLTFAQSGGELRRITVVSGSDFVVSTSAGVSVRDATIRNTFAAGSAGFHATGGTSTLDHVSVEIQQSLAIAVFGPARVVVRDSTITVAAGAGPFTSAGVNLYDGATAEVRRCAISIHATSGTAVGLQVSVTTSSMEASEVTVKITGTATARGVAASFTGGPIRLQGVTIDVAGTDVYGLRSSGNQDFVVVDSQITTSGTTNAGIRTDDGGTIDLSNVDVQSAGTALQTDAGFPGRTITIIGGVLSGAAAIDSGTNYTVKIGKTRVDGTVTVAGTIQCEGAYDGNFAARNATCQ